MKPTLVLILAAAAAYSQTALPPIPRYEVHRAAAKIVIDGKLDDAAWAQAPTLIFQFPWDRQTGAKQNTTARLLWDDDYLYAAYACQDSDIVAHYLNRDDPTYKDDAVEIFLNPDPAQKFYYGLEMNARATLYDYFFAWPQLLIGRVNFDGVLLATHIKGTLNQTGDLDEGWTLEVAIPWKNFAELAGANLPPKPGAVWTANLNRWDGTEPNRRLSQWSNSGLPQPDPHNPARFGRLVFLGGR